MRQIFPVFSQLDQPAAEDLAGALAAVYAYPDRLWVRANMVASVDGAIAVDGRSGALSGSGDRLIFSVLRSLADVILVGAGTARAEGYRQAQPGDLWPQLREGRAPTPPIAVVTRRLDLDLTSSLFRGELARTIVLTTEQVPEHRLKAAARVADVVVTGELDVSAAAAVDALAKRGYRRLLVEGGPALLGGLVADGMLDELCLTISPVLEGGHSTTRVTAAAGPVPATGLTLATLLEDDDFLFSRYVRTPGAGG